MAMGKPINENEILKDGAIESIISDFDKLYNSLKKSDEVLREVGKSMKDVKFPNSSKDFQATLDSMDKLEKAYKTQYQTQVDMDKVKKAQQSAEQALQRQREKGIKAMEREKIAQENLNRPYNVASRELLEMKKRYKDLAYQKSQGIKLTNDEAKEYRSLGRSIKDADGNLKRIDKSTGDNFRNVGNYKNAISGLKGALGQLGLAFGGIALAKGAFETIKNFDELNADMAKTLGVSTEQASKLSLEFTKLGSVTSISGLQEMAVIGGQFGISADQISGFVASMDKANIALGADFGGVEETAKQLGGLRNAFTDIKTTKIEDDLLGIGNALNELSSKGAKVDLVADFANRISAVAIPMGVASGEVLGLSATLAKLNVNAERGGTAVTTIFQRMTQDSAKFAEVAGVSTDEFTKLLNTDMVGAFKLVAKSFKGMDGDNVKMSTTLKTLGLTGSGASEVFLKMSNNTELLDENIKLATKSLTEQDSILQEVDKKSSTVGASLEKVKNSYDAFILGVNDGAGAQNGVINFFDFIAKNLPAIIALVARLVVLWASYKAIMKTMEIANQIKQFGGLKDAIMDSVQSMKDGSKASTGFGSALKGIGFGIAIQIFFELASAFYDIATGANVARDAMARFDKQVAKSSDFAEKKVASIREAEKQQLAKYNEELNKVINNERSSASDKKKAQELYLINVEKLKQATKEELSANRKKAYDRKVEYKDLIEQVNLAKQRRDIALERASKEANERMKMNPNLTYRVDDANILKEYRAEIDKIAKQLNMPAVSGSVSFMEYEQEVLNQLKANISGVNSRLVIYNGALKDGEDATKDFGIKTFETGGKVAKTKVEIIDYTKAIRDLNVEMLKGSDDLTTDYLQAVEKLQNAFTDEREKVNEIKDKDKTKQVIKRNEYLLALEKKYNTDLLKLSADYKKEKAELDRSIIADEIALREQAFDMGNGRKEMQARIDALTDFQTKRDAIINGKGTDEQKKEKIEELEKEHAKRMLAIQVEYVKARIQTETVISEEISRRLGIDSAEYIASQDKIRALQEQLLNLNMESTNFEKKANPLKEILKSVAGYFSNLMDAIQSKIDQTFEKLINAQNKTIENSKNVVANLQAAANAGNLQATQSILAEEKRQEEAQKRIEKLQRRQQMSQFVTGVLGSYSSKVANGDKNALLSAITEATVLSAFLKSLPSFDVGADRLTASGQGVDGKGGFVAINHPDERIMTADHNKIIGFNTTNDQVAKVMSYYNKGLLKPMTEVAPMVMQQDNTEILRSINDGFSKINNYNMSFEQLFSTFSLIVEKRKNGDSFTTKKTFKS